MTPPRITSVEIVHRHFKHKINGYAPQEVDDFLREVASTLDSVLTECSTLRDKLTASEREIAQYRNLETAMHEALIMAQKSADEIRNSARATAESQLHDAQSRVAELNQKLDTLRSERRRIICDLRSTLNAQMIWLDRELDAETLPLSTEYANPLAGDLVLRNPREPSNPFGKEWQAVSPLSHNLG